MADDYLERKRRRKKEQAERRVILAGGFALLLLLVFFAGGALRMYQDRNRLDRTWRGTSNTNTETFAAEADWLIEWERSESPQMRGSGIATIFGVAVQREGASETDFPVAMVSGPFGAGRGSYRVKHSGRFYLQVITMADVKWVIRVREAD